MICQSLTTLTSPPRPLENRSSKCVLVTHRINPKEPATLFESNVLRALSTEENEVEFLVDKLNLYNHLKMQFEDGKPVRRTVVGHEQTGEFHNEKTLKKTMNVLVRRLSQKSNLSAIKKQSEKSV